MMKSALLMAAGAGLATALMLALPALRSDPAGAGDDGSEAAAPPMAEPLVMDAALRARLGIGVSALAPARVATAAPGFARALDIGPLAAIDGEIRSARAAAATSAADAARLTDLAAHDQSASARAVQVAVAQATADRVRVELALRRAALEYGPGLASLSDAQRMALIADVAAGQAALLRIDVPGSPTITRITVGDSPVPVQLLGRAAQADPRVQGAALLAVLRGASVRLAPAGRQLPAIISGSGQDNGTIVPRSALLRQNGDLFVYVAAGNRFERRVISAGRPVAAGWFTTDIAPGTSIVTAGAGSVLAAETGAEAGAGDE
ncbi:MAG: hypothetical protein WCO11_11385 [Sphingomonadales bacterium]